MGDNEDVEANPSGEFMSLKEFFSLSVKIAGTLAGFAGLFLLFGYAIIQSFVIRMKLYGLTNFPQEFYKEATMKFVGDMFETYGRHPYCSAVMVLIISLLVYFFFKHNEDSSNVLDGKWGLIPGIAILLVILFTLRLEIMGDRLLEVSESKKVFIFMISVPMLAVLLMYLALKFRVFMGKPFRFYYVMSVLLMGLFISLPVGYGDNIFDMDVFPVIGLDCSDPAVASLKSLKSDIESQGNSIFFFLMGHSLDREILFDNQSLKPPAKMILVDRNLIKFLHISRNNIVSLRSILREPEAIAPVTDNKATLSNDLPADVREAIGKERK